MPIQPLNKLRKIHFSPEDRLIIVASNDKRGEMPQNGIEFLKALEANSLAVTPTSFAIFGNGSRDYPDTFNQTASVLEKLMEQRGAVRFVRTVQADTASENSPWSAFEDFHKLLTQSLLGIPPSPPLSDGGGVEFQTKDEDTEAFSHLKQWFRAEATMKTTGGVGMDHKMKFVRLDMGTRSYAPMSYIAVLPPNPEAMVQTFLQDLDIDAEERLAFAENMTA
jgi:sulfite reductase alpha subunit-like flavoprotein